MPPPVWTIRYTPPGGTGGAQKTLAEWGLSNVRLDLVSQAADTLTFNAPGRAFDAAELFAGDGIVALFRDGVRWFYGKIVEVPRQGTGKTEDQSYKAAGPWWWLDNIVFRQLWTTFNGSEYRSHLLLNLNEAGANVTTSVQISTALSWAAALGAPLTYTLVGLNVVPPIDEVRDMSVAEVLRKQLRWHPDAVTWFDYATNPPTLHIRPRSVLPGATVNITEGVRVEHVNLTPRYDLLRPSVALLFEQINEHDDSLWLDTAQQIAPPTATGNEVGAFVATIDLQGAKTQTLRASIYCEKIDADSPDNATKIAWWKRKFPYLGNPNIDPNSVMITGISRESELNPPEDIAPLGDLMPNELMEGQLASWMPFASFSEIIRAKISFKKYDVDVSNGTIPPGANIIETAHEVDIPYKAISTDGTSGDYFQDVELQAGEAVPAGLATYLYNALSVLHWDGSILLTEAECSALAPMGRVLNLTGGRAEWTEMNALIQTVSYDIDQGQTLVRFGPPSHLGPADLIELLRVNRNRRRDTPISVLTTGEFSGLNGDVTLGEKTNDKNTTPGDGENKQWTLIDRAPAVNPGQAGLIFHDATNKRTRWQDGAAKIDADVGLRKIHALNGSAFLLGEFSGEAKWDVEGTGGQVHIRTADCAGKRLYIRELPYCDNGVTKKIRVLCSDVYV